MKQWLLLLSVLAFGMTNQANADEMLHVKKSVKIDASSSTVWAKVADFGDLGAWHPAVAKTEIVEGTDNKVGAKRVLTLQDGGKINETLTAYSVNKKSLSYEITESVLPVSDYKSTLSVKSAGKNKSVVTWVASFKHKDGSDDKTATGAINGVFDGGLGNLKKILEAK
jgi:mxaD protein